MRPVSLQADQGQLLLPSWRSASSSDLTVRSLVLSRQCSFGQPCSACVRSDLPQCTYLALPKKKGPKGSCVLDPLEPAPVYAAHPFARLCQSNRHPTSTRSFSTGSSHVSRPTTYRWRPSGLVGQSFLVGQIVWPSRLTTACSLAARRLAKLGRCSFDVGHRRASFSAASWALACRRSFGQTARLRGRRSRLLTAPHHDDQ